MNSNEAPVMADRPDAELVTLSIAGDREAFGQIVSRYQSLICSIAYSGSGNLAQSEDLAQETFVIAWRKLSDLREPEKLRAWLCGIVRNLVQNLHRRQEHEPTHAAKSLESAEPATAPELSPSALAIRQEEEAILWREIEKIPEIYREPLILFYRQHQSVESVAAALDLSEDVVRQRLSRGRKLLQEQVLAFMEGTLARTNPDQTFTTNVMSALPIAAGKAAATTMAAKGALAKGVVGSVAALLWPVVGVFLGWLGIREGIKNVHSDSAQEVSINFPKVGRKREILAALAVKFGPFVVWMVMAGVVDGVLDDHPHASPLFKAAAFTVLGMAYMFDSIVDDSRELWTLTAQGSLHLTKKLITALVIGEFAFVALMMLAMELIGGTHPILFTIFLIFVAPGFGTLLRRIKADPVRSRSPDQLEVIEATPSAEEAGSLAAKKKSWNTDFLEFGKTRSAPFEYRSRWKLFGLPLIHVNTGRNADGERRVAKGWIAVGSVAVGFFAMGGATVGVISLGIAAVGLVSIGGLAIGVIGWGLLGIGYSAMGGIALGYYASGGVALAWQAAYGGLAVACHFAAGGIAWAAHANDAAAQAVVSNADFPGGKSFFERLWELVLLLFLYKYAVAGIKGGLKKRLPPIDEKAVQRAKARAKAKANAKLRREARRILRQESGWKPYLKSLAASVLLAMIMGSSLAFHDLTGETRYLVIFLVSLTLVASLLFVRGLRKIRRLEKIQKELGCPTIPGARWMQAGFIVALVLIALIIIYPHNDRLELITTVVFAWVIWAIAAINICKKSTAESPSGNVAKKQ